MGLKTHLIRHPAANDRSGLTACGAAFFIGRSSRPGCGEFEAMSRIGGLQAVDDAQFFPDPRTHCARCITAWSATALKGEG